MAKLAASPSFAPFLPKWEPAVLGVTGGFCQKPQGEGWTTLLTETYNSMVAM